MAIFTNANTQSPLAALEIASRPDGNYAFFFARRPEDVDALKRNLDASGLNAEVLAETVSNGRPVIITRVAATKEQALRQLNGQGEQLKGDVPRHEFHPWKWRGNFSNLGQGLNLASSLSKGKMQKDKLAFSVLNLTANGVNLVFGGQKDEDVHRKRMVKEQFNELLTPYLAPGTSFPVIDEKPKAIQRLEAKEKPLSMGQKAYGFMQRNSVIVGEIGLRYLGAIAMVFPTTQWKAAAAELGKGSIAGAFKKAVNNNKDKTNLHAGAIYLLGKTIGLFSKVPDPYNPEQPSQLDQVREKVIFRLSSAIETAAAGTLAVGSYKKRDVVGALGGASLVSGLTTRFFAKFGTKQVDMDEIYAHVAEGLAKVDTAKLPQALAQSATFLQEHFEDKKLEFGTIYTRLREDLYRYHDIALFAQESAQPSERKWTQTTRPVANTSHPESPPAGFAQRMQQDVAISGAAR